MSTEIIKKKKKNHLQYDLLNTKNSVQCFMQSTERQVQLLTSGLCKEATHYCYRVGRVATAKLIEGNCFLFESGKLLQPAIHYTALILLP